MSEAVDFDLGSQLTIANVEAVQQTLGLMMSSCNSVAIAAAAIEKIDTAGLQLLCSLKKTLRKFEGDLYWKEVSPVLIKAASVLGVAGYLEIQVNE